MSDDTARWASRWVDTGEPAPAAALRADADALALAWAIKELCYAAWSSEPQSACRAADALAALHAGLHAGLGADMHATPRSATVADEIEALVHWTAAVALLTRGEMAAAITRLAAAAALLERVGRVAEAAQTLVPRIMALSMLGRHDEAVACAEDAQRRFVALGDRRSAAKTSLNLGSLHLRHDAYAEAAQHYRQASVLFARIADREHSVMADIGIADALTALGQADEAALIYRRARMRAATHGLPVLQALADESMALLDLVRGRFGDALAGFESARRRYDALAMPQHLAIAEKQLADAYLELRLLPEALALYEPALERMRALQMPQDEAWTLAQRGRALALRGERALAAASFDAAAQRFDDQHSAVGTASVLLARAELALADGDATAAAPLAQRAAAAFGSAGLASAQLRAETVAAEAAMAGGSGDRAAFARLLAAARQQQLLALQVRCLNGLGAAELAHGEPAAARTAFASAIQLFEEQRAALPGDDLRIAFLTDHLRPYQAMLLLALDDHARAPTAAHAAQVLHWLDRTRARALGERLQLARFETDGDGDPDSDSGSDSNGDDATADAALAALRARLNWLARRLQRQQDDGESTAALETQRREAENALLETTRRRRLAVWGRQPGQARRASDAPDALDALGAIGAPDSPDSPDSPDALHAIPAPDAASTPPQPQPQPRPDRSAARDDIAAGLQRTLQPADAVVEYGVVGDRLFACTVRHDRVHVLPALAPVADVQHALRALRFQIDTLRHGAARLGRHMDQLAARCQVHLQQLHALLWQPLAGPLVGAQRVLVVPPAQLGGLPFAALHDGSASLDQRHALALAPSAQWACRALSRTLQPPRHATVVGDSVRLAHAALEAHTVAACFSDATVLLGADADADALQRHAAQSDVLHLACHAEFRGDNPMFSALHLHGSVLTAERVEALSLPPGIVVLSACETALGSDGPGDEHVGLVRAFFAAGAARVVASLWPVDDAVTMRWMAAFYRALLAGAGPAAAMAQAQADVRRNDAHPYFWAPFALYGGW